MTCHDAQENDFDRRLGRRIKISRILAKESQAELAKSLAISVPDLVAFETGKVPLPAALLGKLATHFNVSADALLAAVQWPPYSDKRLSDSVESLDPNQQEGILRLARRLAADISVFKE